MLARAGRKYGFSGVLQGVSPYWAPVCHPAAAAGSMALEAEGGSCQNRSSRSPAIHFDCEVESIWQGMAYSPQVSFYFLAEFLSECLDRVLG